MTIVDRLKATMGMTNTWMSGATLPMVDEQLIARAFHWFDDMLKRDPRLSAATFVLIEIMQKVREMEAWKSLTHT
jgi:hypothetical protein